MKSQLVLYTNRVNENKYLLTSNPNPSYKDLDIKISSSRPRHNHNNNGDAPNPNPSDKDVDKKPKHNYVKVLVEDPSDYITREIILRVAKKQRGVYL